MKKLSFLLFLLFAGCLLLAQTGLITVISPNGGENWQIGTTHPITWSHFGLTGDVRIDLVSPLESFAPNTIATVPISDGAFNWTIPSTVLPASFYQISVTWLSILTVYIADFSDAPFTISAPGPLPSITVLTPNGGENWQIGSTHAITWNSANLAGNVRIELLSPLMNPLANIIATVPVESGSYNWTISSTIIPAAFYRVGISSMNNTGIFISDASDADFTISAGTEPPTLTVLSPNGGEHWLKGTPHPIIWSSTNLPGHVQIVLQGAANSTTPVFIIARDVPNTGLFNWIIPAVIPVGNNYRVMIRSLYNSSIFDLSDAVFSISEPISSRVRVISPNGGELWRRGLTYNIRWVSLNPASTSRVEIALFRANASTVLPYIIAAAAPNTGTFSWAIPPNLPVGNNYKVRVRLMNLPGGIDFSDGFFSITGNTILLKSISTAQDGQVTLSLESADVSPVTVSIYNIKGQCIRTLLREITLKGTNSLVWDGRDANGNKARHATYLVRVKSSDPDLVRKFSY